MLIRIPFEAVDSTVSPELKRDMNDGRKPILHPSAGPGILWPKVNVDIDVAHSLKKEEEPSLVVVHRSLETDPERLKYILERVKEEIEYSCYIYWLTLPYPSTPEEFKEVEVELYKLIRSYDDVLVAILDSNKHWREVSAFKEVYGIDELPAMIISDEPLDPLTDKKRRGVVLKLKAIKRLIEADKLKEFIAQLPLWGRDSKLESKATFEGVIIPFLKELWNEIKDLISLFL